MKKPDSYLFPCKNNGGCRRLMYEENGWEWSGNYPPYGVVHVYSDSKYGDWGNRVAGFKCCTECHLPVNQAEATKINKLLGLELNTVEIDDDFLDILNEF